MSEVSRNRLRLNRGCAVVRDPNELYRSATPLELFFDVTFIVAVGAAGGGLHHELTAGHIVDGIVGFVATFFMVWWAWVNYTWFASGHDSDDATHRLLTVVQMAGVLVFASGVGSAIED